MPTDDPVQASNYSLNKPSQDGASNVLDQVVFVYERHWLSAVPKGAWPEHLSDCHHDTKGRLEVTRAAVFDIAREAAANPTPASCERTLVATDAWGAGTKVRSVKRTQKVWPPPGASSPTHVGERLSDAAHELLFGAGPIEAYRRLLKGDGHINGLGPAFFTKFLYFIGYDSSAGDHRPLILDRYVARGLNRTRGTSWPDTGWAAEQYAEYLAWGKEQARSSGPLSREDQAEYEIWQVGKGGSTHTVS